MLAVIVCSLVTIVMLGGLLVGLVVGTFRARGAIADALVYAPLAPVNPRASATAVAAWRPA